MRTNNLTNSTPNVEEFDPVIPYQAEVIDQIYNKYDYSLGSHEVLLSGSVGSAKSILMAHLAVRHCIENSGARVLLGRKALPDLKATIFQKILEHMDTPALVPNRHFRVRETNGHITWRNGSEILSRSWSDKKYKKMRSLELSMALIEELTENDDEDKRAYDEIKMRVGRLPHIVKPLIIAATNPDEPDHWAYKYFIESTSPTRHVFYSVTTDNPFLPPQYVEQLKADLDPKMAQRMIYGQWVSIAGEVVYHQYDHDVQFMGNQTYRVDPSYPVILTWDFNIGEGKPMSLAVMQYLEEQDEFHIFGEVVVHGGRTADTIEEAHHKGYLNPNWTYDVCGDATGVSRNTRSVQSDYDIIRKELGNRNIRFTYKVPASNPSVRERHNKINSYCLNELGQRRIFVYSAAKTCDDGLRMTKLKKGSAYIEDDSKAFQHITTAIGYAIMFIITQKNRVKQGTVRF